MKFVDEARIEVIGGRGGDGCASFRREKFIPKGGPDGGDGGRGGSVVAVADRNVNTLIEYRYTRRHQAPNGEHGRGSDCYGAAGADIVLPCNDPAGLIELLERWRPRPEPNLALKWERMRRTAPGHRR